ncbi:hypothetical protein MOQ_005743 [Trypanosoma cruzi marinkellei]|uniref:Uncharacterized protein n=1 Tax=Trypanosoma cruzi marinkellei TaxID=85056 RepID=K2M684_TRYCR|nr:hypothetical protein MOQ_005743 [Trypanosoma cruzi marinkellei]
MFNSPLSVDQRSCPSFIKPKKDYNVEFLGDSLNRLPLSLRDVALHTPSLRRDASGSLSPSPSSPSARCKRRSNREVYEAMLQRDTIAAEKKEEARNMAVQQELSQCRPTPRISAMSQNLSRDTVIYERLERLHKEKQKRDEFQRREREQEKQQLMEGWFVPNITDRGRHTRGRALQETEEYLNCHRQQEKERTQRAEERRHHRLAEEMAELYSSPRINLRSADIVQRARERNGFDQKFYIDSMLERAAIARLARWERHEEQERAESWPFSPRITAHAATLKRDGDVVDRLIFSAKKPSVAPSGDTMHTKCAPRVRSRSEGHSSRRKKDTRPHEQEHFGLTRSPNPRLGVSCMDSMEERRRRYKIQHEKKMRAIWEAERRLHKPTINPYSEMIASSLPVKSTEHLTTVRERRENAIVQESDSSRLASSHGSLWIDAREAMRYSDANCYHRGPEEYVSPIQTPGWGSGNTSLTRGKDNTFYERMCRWKQLRDEKIQRMRDELQKEKMRRSMEANNTTLNAEKCVEGDLASPDVCPGKSFPEEYKTPRAPTGGAGSVRTPVVLSLLKRPEDEMY